MSGRAVPRDRPLKDGASLPGWPVDIADALKRYGQAFNARDQNQRGALTTLDDGSTFRSAAITAIAATTTEGW
jgi:hypothetical protein